MFRKFRAVLNIGTNTVTLKSCPQKKKYGGKT